MSTTNPRINITVPAEIASILGHKARKHNQPVSKIALDLIMTAMERDEDIYYSRLAEKRDCTVKKWVKHDEAWK